MLMAVVVHRCQSWVIGCFPSLEAFVETSGIMTASSQGGDIQVWSNSDFLCSVSKVNGVFSNRNLFYIFEGT